MTYSYRLELCYVGTAYAGWQKQSRGEKTVQGELETALQSLVKGDVVTLASGRTDAGVHAFHLLVRADLPLKLPVEGLIKGVNSLLPNDISVIGAQLLEEYYHPIGETQEKCYQYLFATRPLMAFEKNWVAELRGEVDYDLMTRCAKLFVGEHDFRAFHCVGSNPPSTRRNIIECKLTKIKEKIHPLLEPKEYYLFEVKGEGFLKQMVRLLVGTMWSVGLKRSTLQDVSIALNGQDKKLGIVAPAHALYLKEAKDRYSQG